MNYEQKIARINYIREKAPDSMLNCEVLFNRKKKILIGTSFDSIYYYEIFILFTGVLHNTESSAFLAGEITWRGLTLEPKGLDEKTQLHRTAIISGNELLELLHKDIFYCIPQKPFYTGIGIEAGDPNYPLLDFTKVVDKCYYLEDFSKI